MANLTAGPARALADTNLSLHFGQRIRGHRRLTILGEQRIAGADHSANCHYAECNASPIKSLVGATRRQDRAGLSIPALECAGGISYPTFFRGRDRTGMWKKPLRNCLSTFDVELHSGGGHVTQPAQ
jgi:hypothetical protein